jgi:CRISPR-associated endonuclease/helicase Cas3
MAMPTSEDPRVLQTELTHPVVEVTFPVLGLTLPSNNGYPLLGAIAKVMNGEYLRAGESLESIGGRGNAKGVIRVTPETRLRIRTFRPSDICVGLGCKVLDVSSHLIQLGIPEVRELAPGPLLRSRIVTYALKHKLEPKTTPSAEMVLESARREMERKGIQGVVSARTIPDGPRKGEPIRRIVRICDRNVVGYALQVVDLDSRSSILLQSLGLGGKRHHGCGIFVDPEARRVAR